MGPKALKAGKGLSRVWASAHKSDAAQDKVKTKQGTMILNKYLDWGETLHPKLWLGEPS